MSIQNYQQNQGGGTYWDLEQCWAGQLKSGVGVDVTVREMSRKGEDRPYHRHVSWLERHKDSLVLGEIDFVNTMSPKGRVAEGVAFRIAWRNVSELFRVVSALRRNASQTEAAMNMAAIHKQNQIFTSIVGATLGSREGTLVLPRRSSGLSSTPNSSQTLRHIAIKATAEAALSYSLCSMLATRRIVAAIIKRLWNLTPVQRIEAPFCSQWLGSPQPGCQPRSPCNWKVPQPSTVQIHKPC
jgi:hypothetical protein